MSWKGFFLILILINLSASPSVNHQKSYLPIFINWCISNFIHQNSLFSWLKLLNLWRCHWVSDCDFYMYTKSDPRDLWPLRHLMTVMRKHDVINIWICWQFLLFWHTPSNSDKEPEFLRCLEHEDGLKRMRGVSYLSHLSQASLPLTHLRRREIEIPRLTFSPILSTGRQSKCWEALLSLPSLIFCFLISFFLLSFPVLSQPDILLSHAGI